MNSSVKSGNCWQTMFRFCHYGSLLLLTLLPLLSKNQPVWQHIGTSQGLPDAGITCIYRTKDGTLYTGTHDGLVIMRGNQFRRVTTSTEAGSQVNPFINCIISGKNGMIYAGSRNALWCYNPQNNRLTTLIHPYASIGGISHLTFNRDSSLLVAATTRGFLKATIQGNEVVINDSLPAPGGFRSYLLQGTWYYYLYRRALMKEENGKLIALRLPGPVLDLIWLPKKQKWLLLCQKEIILMSRDGEKCITLNEPEILKDLPEIVLLYLDKEENVYFRIETGLVRLDHESLKPAMVLKHEPGNDFSLGSSAVAHFYEDELGSSWVACNNSGLHYISYPMNSMAFLSNQSLDCQVVWSGYYDPVQALLWIGTDNGIKRVFFDENSFRLEKVLLPPGIKNFAVTGIIPLNDHEMLVTTFGHGCWLANRKSGTLSPWNSFNRFHQSKNVYGAVWQGENRLLVHGQSSVVKCDIKTGKMNIILPEETIDHFNLAVTVTANGEVLLGNGKGLTVADSGGKRLFHFTSKTGDTNSVSSNVVITIKELTDHSIFAGTMGGGLCRFDRPSGRFQRIRLVTNPVNIFGIYEIDRNTILLTTSNGLCLYNLKTGSSAILNRDNLLPFSDFNQFALHDGGSFLFTAGEKGVLIIRKKGLTNLFHSVKQIIVRHNGVPVDRITIPPGSQTLDVSVMLNNLLPPEKYELRYHLDGFEHLAHLMPDGQMQVIYNFLPPGKYQLVVTARDPNNVSRIPDRSVEVIVTPSWWQTPMFRILLSLFLLTLLVIVIRYISQIRLKWRLKKLEDEQKLARERARISRELHDNVGSQLTYLIAGLEVSEHLLKQHQTDKASASLRNLHDATRESMQQLRQAIWTLNRDEITLTDLAEQFRNWMIRVMEPHPDIVFHFDLQIDSKLILDPVRSLNLYRILQESVNNVIKHAGPCDLRILIKSDGVSPEIEVTDTGKGFTPGDHEGNGMRSLRTRAMESDFQLKVTSAPGQGTRIHLK